MQSFYGDADAVAREDGCTEMVEVQGVPRYVAVIVLRLIVRTLLDLLEEDDVDGVLLQVCGEGGGFALYTASYVEL